MTEPKTAEQRWAEYRECVQQHSNHDAGTIFGILNGIRSGSPIGGIVGAILGELDGDGGAGSCLNLLTQEQQNKVLEAIYAERAARDLIPPVV